MLPPVVKTVDVPCSPEQAFTTFTTEIASWWPLDKNTVSAMEGKVAKSVRLDPITGGKITETNHAGEDVIWGTVTEFTPHSKLALAWHINRPAEDATFVDVAFETSDKGALVTLKHYGWENLGDDAEGMRAGYDGGWVGVFETAFANACS